MRLSRRETHEEENSLSLLFAPCSLRFACSAEAQQPTKIPRIGYLAGASPSAIRPASRHSGRVCASLGMWRGKTLSLNIDLRGKTDRLPALAAELVRLKVDVIVTGWSDTNPCRQGSNDYDSHCHDAGSRSCWQRVRRQPCATWWKYHWIVHSCPGVRRKTTGASEGDYS